MVQKINPIHPWGVIGAMYFQKMQFLGVFRPFLQRSLLSLNLVGIQYVRPAEQGGNYSPYFYRLKKQNQFDQVTSKRTSFDN